MVSLGFRRPSRSGAKTKGLTGSPQVRWAVLFGAWANHEIDCSKCKEVFWSGPAASPQSCRKRLLKSRLEGLLGKNGCHSWVLVNVVCPLTSCLSCLSGRVPSYRVLFKRPVRGRSVIRRAGEVSLHPKRQQGDTRDTIYI